MEQHARDQEPIVLSGDEFLRRLGDEISRSDRYEHPFTVLTLRPPEWANDLGELSPRWLESEAAGLTRGCDVVTVLNEGPLLIVMLPETDVSGGALVLDRIREAIDDGNHEWQYGLLQYPDNRSQLMDLMQEAA